MDKTLHVYADEIGDIGPYDERSPIYALSLIFVDEATDRSKGLSALKREEKRFGLGRFIHSGNLIRGEKPYEGKLREERQRLFWALLTYAAGIDFRFSVAMVSKEILESPLEDCLIRELMAVLDRNAEYLSSFDRIVLHYDGGQKLCTHSLNKVFLNRYARVSFEKTAQSEDVFMQIADLLCVLENISYKLERGHLSRSEEAFLGKRQKIKKEVLGRFKKKRV